MKIYKYKIDLRKPKGRDIDYYGVDMPKGAQVLSVASQKKYHIYVWAIIDPDEEKEEKLFFIPGTGDQFGLFPETKKFIGTVVDGDLVWHVFENIT